jgi:UDP-N-acetylglucosamine diphosphorylase / glucose-1-phosphate thymidylyltransferase / UDP-N-acetylgalactosamine diphosphorylase / glucosamine-1-phosphate N-acetyltransferase / galactosamine-1-phosphate N-acetyltransferase
LTKSVVALEYNESSFWSTFGQEKGGKSMIVVKDSGRAVGTLQFIPKVYDLGEVEHPELFRDLDFPWEVITRIQEYIESLFPQNPEILAMHSKDAKIHSFTHVGQNVLIGAGTVVEPGAVIFGPAYIGEDCKILAGARIRENVILSSGCEIGTEVSNSFLGCRVKAWHTGHIGHSIIGSHVNLGAGASISNRRNTKRGYVQAYLRDNVVLSTGQKKYGAVIGTNCQIGCNVVINPGTTLLQNVVVDPCISVRGFVDSYTYVRNTGEPCLEKLAGSARRGRSRNGGR